MGLSYMWGVRSTIGQPIGEYIMVDRQLKITSHWISHIAAFQVVSQRNFHCTKTYPVLWKVGKFYVNTTFLPTNVGVNGYTRNISTFTLFILSVSIIYVWYLPTVINLLFEAPCHRYPNHIIHHHTSAGFTRLLQSSSPIEALCPLPEAMTELWWLPTVEAD